MLRSRPFQLLLLLAVAAGVLLVAIQPGQIRLVRLPVPARDAPEAVPGESSWAFTVGSDERGLSGAELRKVRNAIVSAWREALEAYAHGQGSLRAAERIEAKLWGVRRQVGEIDAQAMHAGRALLFGRERARLEQLAALDPPQASAAALRVARAYVAREQLLAGQPGHDYAALRAAQLGALRDRVQYLKRQRPVELPAAMDDLAEFERSCPPEAELRARLGQD